MSSDTVTKDAVLLHCHTLCPANVANTGTACRAHGWGAGTVHGWGAGTVHGWGAGTAGSRRRGAALAGWWRGAVGAEAQARSPGAKDGTMHVEGKAGLRLAPAARPNRPASAAPLRYPGHSSPGPASHCVGGTLHRPACPAHPADSHACGAGVMSSDTVTKDAVLLHCHTLCPANVTNTGTACRAHGWGAGTAAPLRYPGHLSPGPASRCGGGTLHRPACPAHPADSHACAGPTIIATRAINSCSLKGLGREARTPQSRAKIRSTMPLRREIITSGMCARWERFLMLTASW